MYVHVIVCLCNNEYLSVSHTIIDGFRYIRKYVHTYISLSTIVLNSRDRPEKNSIPLSHLHNMPHNTLYLKKLTRIHRLLNDNTIPSLNSVKILTVRSVENFKIFQTYVSVFGLTASLPYIRPTSTRSMVPDFSHTHPIYKTVVPIKIYPLRHGSLSFTTYRIAENFRREIFSEI